MPLVPGGVVTGACGSGIYSLMEHVESASVPDYLPIFDYIPLDRLRFDPENPRFPTSLDGHDRAAVLTFMIQDANLLELMASIAGQGFFPGEPLLVSANEEDPGTWLVIEGNRRLAACMLL